MKHLRKFNESKEEITEQVIKDCFSHTFDLCEEFEVSDAYFDITSKIKRNWASNDFSNDYTACELGFDISIEHKFYDKTDLSDFEKYTEMINQLLEDVKRFTDLYSPKDIFFEEGGNSEIHILIQP